MSNGLKDIIHDLCQKNDAESFTQAVRLIRYIFSQGEQEENMISEYFSWFKKMPTFYRQIAIKRTTKMVNEAIEKKPWENASEGKLTEHKEILAAIIVSQSQYHYDILHELRSNVEFIEDIRNLFQLSENSQKKIRKYAENLYLPGQIKRNTAPLKDNPLYNENRQYIENLENPDYQAIIDARGSSEWGNDSIPDSYNVNKIWHYVRTIPESEREKIVSVIEEIVKKVSDGVNHIAIHRLQRNIFDRLFLDEIKGLANEKIATVVIPNYLWQLGTETGKMVLKKINIGKESIFILESYLGKVDFHEKLENVRNFPGITSDINPLRINYYKSLEEKKINKSISIEDDHRRATLKMVEALVASTFKTKKFDFENNNGIDYYDYYYLPYPVIRYIFNYFSCFDVNNEFFLTIEFKREDFQGKMEGDLWISIPDMKKVEEIFAEISDKEITTLIRLLKSISYRYIVYTISLMAVSVGFKNLSINIKKSNEEIQLDETSYENDYLVRIAEEIGCRPLYTKYISDFQYKPSQVKLKSTVAKIKVGMNCLEFTEKDPVLFIGIDIGGTNIKIRFFICKDNKLEEVKGSFFSFKTFGKTGGNDFYSSSEDFVKYIADEISKKYKEIDEKKSWKSIYVGISFPGPVFDNQLAGISGVVRKLDKELKDIQPDRQILDSHIDIIQEKVKIVDPLKERLKETFSKLNVSYENIFVNMTNDGTAEGIGHLHKFSEKSEKKGEYLGFDYIIVLKAGTGTAGAVLKKEKEYFILEEGPCEFGKLAVNTMRSPHSFETNDCDKISSFILGKGSGGWPGINRYISQSGLNHLLKILNNEEMFGKMKNLTSEEIGKMIEHTGIKAAPYQRQAWEAALRLGYIIADTLATIKIIYKISDEAHVGLILSGGVLPRKNKKATGDYVVNGVKKRLANVHGIFLLEDDQSKKDADNLKYKNWILLPDMPDKETELGCRGSAIYSLLKEDIKNGKKLNLETKNRETQDETSL